MGDKNFGLPRCIVNHGFNRTSTQPSTRNLPNNAVEAVLEPFDGLDLGDFVVGADGGLAATALGNTLTRAGPGKKKLIECPLCCRDSRNTHMQQ